MPTKRFFRSSGVPVLMAVRITSLPMPGEVCAVPGCWRHPEARGYCPSHYQRLRRYGDPTAGRLTKREVAELRALIGITDTQLAQWHREDQLQEAS